ncbi:MAG: hypothetical protein LBV61_05980 [Burkholderiaceae bacterium]|jgi:hypothetical protein|nr:hypothetical protein [Burkholderiaceae bacterium]
MKFDFESLRKNVFLKWFMTAIAAWKLFTFCFLAIPAVWNEPVPLLSKIVALAIGGIITWALCYVALQYWRK